MNGIPDHSGAPASPGGRGGGGGGGFDGDEGGAVDPALMAALQQQMLSGQVPVVSFVSPSRSLCFIAWLRESFARWSLPTCKTFTLVGVWWGSRSRPWGEHQRVVQVAPNNSRNRMTGMRGAWCVPNTGAAVGEAGVVSPDPASGHGGSLATGRRQSTDTSPAAQSGTWVMVHVRKLVCALCDMSSDRVLPETTSSQLVSDIAPHMSMLHGTYDRWHVVVDSWLVAARFSPTTAASPHKLLRATRCNMVSCRSASLGGRARLGPRRCRHILHMDPIDSHAPSHEHGCCRRRVFSRGAGR